MSQTDKDKQLMEMVIQLAREKMLAGEGGPFGAAIVRDGEVVAKGWNRVASTNDPTAHAEIVAIRRSCSHLQTFDLSDCVLYCSCEPCPMCMAAIYWSGIKRVIYGASRHDAEAIGFRDNFIYRELELPNKERSIGMKQMLRRESLSSFEAWSAMEDKIEY